jgi:hypothetical protein
MLLMPEKEGPRTPLLETPPRVPGMVRRTSTIDSARPNGFEKGEVVFDARAREILTLPDGRAEVLATGAVQTQVGGFFRGVEWIDAQPAPPGLQQLVGASVAMGFRKALAGAVPEEADARSPLFLLLDDLPGAFLVSGYAGQRADLQLAPDKQALQAEHLERQADGCAGWASDATLMVTFRKTGEVPTSFGPEAPTLLRDDDPDAWHAYEPLTPHGMRRRRRMDLLSPDADGRCAFDVHFRDSYQSVEGVESCLHEYTVTGVIDVVSRTFTEVEAQTRVLPWIECPNATASATRLGGYSIAGLRDEVRRDFRGVTTCTHLNDTMRALADLDVMLDRVMMGG